MDKQKTTIIAFHGAGQNCTIFRSLLKPLFKNLKNHDWIIPQGFHSKKEGGFGWYKYDKNDEINWTDRQTNIDKLIEQYNNEDRIIFIGFSEGGQFALDISRYFPNCKGVVALSPSFGFNMHIFGNINAPVIMITSPHDSYVSIRNSRKWKKYIIRYIELLHHKGHKVYLPMAIRQTIRNVLF